MKEIKYEVDTDFLDLGDIVVKDFSNQMARSHARKIDDNFSLIVKRKPKWMPSFLYRAVIKRLVVLNQII